MEGALKGLFGGGDDNDHQKQARDYVDRYTTGDPTEGYSEDEAMEHFQRVQQHAPPEVMETATRRTVENLPENQRTQLAEMLQQRQSGRGGVDIQRSGNQGQSGGGGIDDLLGGLMGGGTASGRGGGGGGIGDLFGGLMGGSGGGRAGSVDRSNTGGGIGDLLGSPVGKALVGGVAAFAIKEMMDRR